MVMYKFLYDVNHSVGKGTWGRGGGEKKPEVYSCQASGLLADLTSILQHWKNQGKGTIARYGTNNCDHRLRTSIHR